MKIQTKRLIASFSVIPVVFFGAWLGGFGFERGTGMFILYIVSLFLIGSVYFYPQWVIDIEIEEIKHKELLEVLSK